MLFYFGIRVEVEVEDANERIFLWGQMRTGGFSFGVRIGVEDAKSLDLLHDFSLCVQTCLSFFFCVQADAFCTWRNAVAKAGREKKSPEIAKVTTQSTVFFKGRINEMFVNYKHSLFQTFQPRPSLNCLFAVHLSCIFWIGRKVGKKYFHSFVFSFNAA